MVNIKMVNVVEICEFPMLSALQDCLAIDELTLNRSVDKRITSVNSIQLDEYGFQKDDQSKDTRRPQGAAICEQFIINSWYFRSDKWEGNCKLTVMNTEICKYVNVVPVQRSEDKLVKIQCHAGGLATIDSSLFLADSTIQAIRVFDLRHIYPVDENDTCIKSNQEFIKQYGYMLPEVRRIQLQTPDSASLSYVSIATIDSQTFFLLGNFYSTKESKYKKGGKSMIWLLPIEVSKQPFPSVDLSKPNYQIEPLFPTGGPSGTVTRIQGALIKNKVLILNRSYSDETKQLIVMKYDNILSSSTPSTFFDGKVSKPQEYDQKNWLYGCEDLSFDSGFNNITTVTEFANNRHSFVAPYFSFVNLLPIS